MLPGVLMRLYAFCVPQLSQSSPALERCRVASHDTIAYREAPIVVIETCTHFCGIARDRGAAQRGVVTAPIDSSTTKKPALLPKKVLLLTVNAPPHPVDTSAFGPG